MSYNQNKDKEYYFPDDMWRIIKEFAGIHGKIKCQCGYYLHTPKNTDGFAIYNYNTCTYTWCCKKYYESLYKDLYERHSIWKYILKENRNINFDYKFNYFNKNKKMILKYILLEKQENDSSRRRKTIEKLLIDFNKENTNKNTNKNKDKHKKNIFR
jgi:hypothetical protein